MKKIKHLKEYSELIGGLLMALLLALYVYFSDWKIKFPDPPIVPKTTESR